MSKKKSVHLSTRLQNKIIDACIEKENWGASSSQSNNFGKEQSYSQGLCLQSKCTNNIEKAYQIRQQSLYKEALTKIIEQMPYTCEYEINPKPQKENYAFLTNKKAVQESENRDIKVLQRKKMTNYKLLMDQTKQLLSLNYTQILNDEIRSLKSAIMETSINFHRIKIKNRSCSKRILLNSKSLGKNSWMDESQKVTQADNTMKNVLTQRIKLIKDDISQIRQFYKQRINNKLNENKLIQKQIGMTSALTRKKTQSLVQFYEQLHASSTSSNQKSVFNFESRISAQKKVNRLKRSVQRMRKSKSPYYEKSKSPYYS